MMTPFGSLTWKYRSPHGSVSMGVVNDTPSFPNRSYSPSMSSMTKATRMPLATVLRRLSGFKLARSLRRKIRLNPASFRDKETKPSAAMSSLNPKCSFTKLADALSSSTFSEIAEAVMSIGTPFKLVTDGSADHYRTVYIVQVCQASNYQLN